MPRMSKSTSYFTSLGGVGEVGASAHLIEIDGLTVLLDCGLHPKKDGKSSLPDFSRLRRAPDAVIISHGHHDHCAALPYFLKMFPTTVPYATVPTVRILNRMLHNSVSVMEKIQLEQGVEDYPLYDHADVENAIRRLYGIPMGQNFAILPDSPVRVMFSSAGHVLGSASVLIKGTDHTVFYTSDVCAVDQELMPALAVPDEAKDVDTLIIESTYGANEEADRIVYEDEISRFAEGINRVINRGGVVLVPSFALGRTQEVLNILARLQDTGKIPYVRIYASGLGRAIYEIYARFRDELRPGADLVPLDEFESIGDVWDPVEARKLLKEPCIIVATAGMLIENTPSAMIAQHLVKDPRHGIFFVGYCDPATLGYKLRQAQKGDSLIFQTGGEAVTLQLDDIQWFHFSAHAHRQELIQLVDTIQSKNLIYVHGDPPALDWMHGHSGNGRKKFLPKIGQPIAL